MQEINGIISNAEKLAREGQIGQALELFLDAIDRYQLIDGELADEIAFQMGWFLFGQNFYIESLETWKKLQEKGYRRETISQIVEEAFIEPNQKEFQSIYGKNLEQCRGQIHTEEIPPYGELPFWFIPAEDGVYYLYGKKDRMIGEKVTANLVLHTEDEIFSGENVFDAVVFWKSWNYREPLEAKQLNGRRMVCFLSDGAIPFSYLQLPEFESLFHKEWHIFDDFGKMQEFFHQRTELSFPKLYKGIQEDTGTFMEWAETEHRFCCSKEGRNKENILLTIGIPSFNRGHRALENIRHLQNLHFDSEIEFLVCDNCSQSNTEGYQEIEKLAEEDSRITYYRFPDNPGGNLSFVETVERASGKFCCMMSDEDTIYLDNVWKYLFLIQKYGEELGFISAAGAFYYKENVNRWFQKGGRAFEEVFWGLNYLSGCIFGTKAHRELNLRSLYEWQAGTGDGNYFNRSYAHNAAAMRCAIERDIYICGETLFQEGEDENVKASEDSGGKVILDYARADLRIKQMDGLIALLNEWKDMLSPEVIKNSYRRAANKLFVLIDLIREKEGLIECSFLEAHNAVLRAVVERIQDLEVEVDDADYADMITLFSFWYIKYSKLCKEEGKKGEV